MQLLLDTCAALWISSDAPLSDEIREALTQANADGSPIFVSPISAWEIGLLVAKRRLALPTNPQTWFDRLLQAPAVELADLPPSVLIASSFLPGDPPPDPADRIVIATARHQDLTLATRDRRILSYARAGHLRALAC